MKTLILFLTLLLTVFTGCGSTEKSRIEDFSDTTPKSSTDPIIDESSTIEDSSDTKPKSSIESTIDENSMIEDSSDSTTETSTEYPINENSTLEDFKGKPSVIVFAATYCSHCRKAAPEFEAGVWNNFKHKANLWINVTDGGKFDIKEAAQGLNKNLDYNTITGDQCEYVPSWVVLDKEGNVSLKSCGSEKSETDMGLKLVELLNS